MIRFAAIAAVVALGLSANAPARAAPPAPRGAPPNNRYTQHNPTAKDGPEGLQGFINFLKDKFPNNKSEIKRIFADGDYVIVHVHAVREPGTRGSAIIDIFKLENGKVVEHWDVVQPIPENPQNNNGMF
jgi:predicted SnoaL-like aldol condensation-catalyzing enzyme